jgi:hypothetical protein
MTPQTAFGLSEAASERAEAESLREEGNAKSPVLTCSRKFYEGPWVQNLVTNVVLK